MTDSVLENEKNNVSVVNIEDENGAVTLDNGDKVNAETGKILNDDGDSVVDENANLPSTSETNIADLDISVLSDEEKENQMRQEVKGLGLKNLDAKLMYEMMAVPTYSDYEYRMTTWLILWARKHNIEHTFDDYGNLYFIKGKPSEGKFYPCVTAHLDTVQHKAKAYVLTGAELDLKTRVNKKGQHEVYIDGIGTGSDDKNAILIALHMFEKFDTLKGAFYLGEEVGCNGSSNMDVKFFDDVSYVIGFDSPELNRAAWRLMGKVKMFTADFYKTHMKPICDKYGVTKFYSESITDEAYITDNTGLMTMNFGNGGYCAHTTSEYFIVEELDNALSMGIELVETIPTDVQHKVMSFTWEKGPITGQVRQSVVYSDDDEEYLKNLGDNDLCSTYAYNSYNSKHLNTNTTTSIVYGGSSSKNETKPDYIAEETIKYISDVYEERIEEIMQSVKTKCHELGISFNKTFASIFRKEIKI